MNSPKVVRGFSIAPSIRQSRDSNEGILFYHHGHNLKCEVLRNECLDYIDEEVLLGKDFSELPLNVISTFLDEKKKIDEVKIFLGLVNWAKVEAKRKGYWSNSIVWRGLIGEENLRKINFDAMSSEEFAQQIFPLGIMNVNEVADIFLRRFGAPRPTSGSFF